MKRKELVKAIITVALLITIIGGTWIGFTFALGTSTPLFVVISGSMIPVYEVGDIVVVQGVPITSINIGDIIVFHEPGSLNPIEIVHRVFEVTQRDGETILITKGDANRYPDPWFVTNEDFIGKVIFSIPKIGTITIWLAPPVNYIIIAIILFLIFILEILPTGKKEDSTNTPSNVEQKYDYLNTSLTPYS